VLLKVKNRPLSALINYVKIKSQGYRFKSYRGSHTRALTSGDAGRGLSSVQAKVGCGRRALVLGHLAHLPEDRRHPAGRGRLHARQVADQLGHANPSMTLDVYFGRQVVSAEGARMLGR
jgi:integrase